MEYHSTASSKNVSNTMHWRATKRRIRKMIMRPSERLGYTRPWDDSPLTSEGLSFLPEWKKRPGGETRKNFTSWRLRFMGIIGRRRRKLERN